MRNVLSEPTRGDTEFVNIGQAQFGVVFCQRIHWYHYSCGVPCKVIEDEYGITHRIMLAILQKAKNFPPFFFNHNLKIEV